MGNYLFLAQNNLHFCVANRILLRKNILRFFTKPFSHVLTKKIFLKKSLDLFYIVGQKTLEDSNSFFVKTFGEQLL